MLWLPHYRNRIGQSPPPQQAVLLTGVERLEVTYWQEADFDGKAGWQAEWQQREALPRLVRFHLVLSARGRGPQPGHRRLPAARPVAGVMRRWLRICRASAVAESEGRNPLVQHPATQADKALASGRGARGFALLVVLWTMALLALLATQFTSAGRVELRIAMNLQANATAQAAADGALYEAMFHLMQGTWMPDGRPRIVQVGGATVRVRAKNLAWKVNPNLASVPVLRALLAVLGVDSSRAMTLAQAIVDWRTPNQVSLAGGPKIAAYRTAGLPYGPANRPFDSVDELGLVIGMTPALLARMKPFLSVYQEGDATDLLANPVQAAAEDAPLIGDGWQLGATGRVMVALIEADAASAAGGRFTRRAVVRLRAEPSLEQSAYEVLTWESGE